MEDEQAYIIEHLGPDCLWHILYCAQHNAWWMTVERYFDGYNEAVIRNHVTQESLTLPLLDLINIIYDRLPLDDDLPEAVEEWYSYLENAECDELVQLALFGEVKYAID